MFDELRSHGFIDGQNLTVDWRAYEPSIDLVSHFEALGKAHPDVIYAGGPTSIRAAQKATTTIPILGITMRQVQLTHGRRRSKKLVTKSASPLFHVAPNSTAFVLWIIPDIFDTAPVASPRGGITC
jgi:hypothetical protein